MFLLDQLVDGFDDLVEKYGLEKIKTLGDGYMAVCGLSMPHLDSDKRAIDCALEMIAQVRRFNYEKGLDLDLRVGINTGEVIAGTVGKTRFAYDVWGETVNVDLTDALIVVYLSVKPSKCSANCSNSG